MIDKSFFEKENVIISNEGAEPSLKYIMAKYYSFYFNHDMEAGFKIAEIYIEKLLQENMLGENFMDTFILRKRFKLPIGHRLSKHNGLCKNIHGHNIVLEVALKSCILDKNDMIIDFSDVKKLMLDIIESLDHCCLLNETDIDEIEFMKKRNMKVIPFSGDPTAENLSKYVYQNLKYQIENTEGLQHVSVYEVRIWENENSDISYSCK